MTLRHDPTTEHATDPTASITFIGNATVLIRYADVTILTDPNFVHRGEEVPLGYGLSTTRLTDPAMEIDALPALDLVVLSHYHGDHFDHVAEEQLDRALPIITTADAADTLAEKGFFAARSLETWQTHQLTKAGTSVRVTAMPGKHAPGALTIALPQVMGSLLEFSSPDASTDRDGKADLRLYITGDTIFYEGFREIPERHPEIDIALLHLGGTRVMGLTVTMDAEQGVELLRTVKPRLAMPIHYDDYEAFKSPLTDFATAVEQAGLASSVTYLERGRRMELPTPARVTTA